MKRTIDDVGASCRGDATLDIGRRSADPVPFLLPLTTGVAPELILRQDPCTDLVLRYFFTYLVKQCAFDRSGQYCIHMAAVILHIPLTSFRNILLLQTLSRAYLRSRIMEQVATLVGSKEQTQSMAKCYKSLMPVTVNCLPFLILKVTF